MTESVLNALTVDVEDYFQVSAFESTISRNDWGSYTSRVEPNTHKVLNLLSERNITATFFVLGWVAERCPHLVREIAHRGHEVACHGYSHRLIYDQSPEEFRTETLHSKAVLEDQAQQPVVGYRAASYSITERSLWALEILVEAGFRYDSSVFPIRHDRYGMHSAPRHIHTLRMPNGKDLIEFPPTTAEWFGLRIPMAGGGYFRLYPLWFTRWVLKSLNRKSLPFIFYIHPWEFDPDQPRVAAGWVSRFRHYQNLTGCSKRFQSLLGDFRFTTAKKVLSAQDELNDGVSIPVTEVVLEKRPAIQPE